MWQVDGVRRARVHSLGLNDPLLQKFVNKKRPVFIVGVNEEVIWETN